jgi:hypothetical protein
VAPHAIARLAPGHPRWRMVILHPAVGADRDLESDELARGQRGPDAQRPGRREQQNAVAAGAKAELVEHADLPLWAEARRHDADTGANRRQRVLRRLGRHCRAH